MSPLLRVWLLLLLLAGPARACSVWSPGGLAATDWKCIPSSPPPTNPDCSDTAANTLTVMADQSQRITSSGTLASWDINCNVAGKTSLMIWRQGPTPTGFVLACREEVTVAAPGLQHIVPDPTARKQLAQSQSTLN